MIEHSREKSFQELSREKMVKDTLISKCAYELYNITYILPLSVTLTHFPGFRESIQPKSLSLSRSCSVTPHLVARNRD